ncbi:glycine oxidase ThiO [Mycolicibacterium conceptionense]|uniref:Glycine oxidase ThiO n=1 Tax=Mycolicibacterium conceptionense TaxID=451644 RepID=A0A0U1DA14_9MYCO|nr:glycine oxidase ThiO [Mycolicibacterium conceptionense]
MATGAARTLAVIGGGVIGLSVARRAALDGWCRDTAPVVSGVRDLLEDAAR